MNSLVQRVIEQQEDRLGVPLDYLRSLADTSTALFAKFGLTTPAATHRKHAPRNAWHLARLGATRAQDCGTCVQIVVNLALSDGVTPDVLRAALADELDALSPMERHALQFGAAVAAQTDAVEVHRAELVQLLGTKASVELALAVALAQVYPILKRGLGQAVACALIDFEIGDNAAGASGPY